MKKVFTLAALSALMSVAFSFMSAPFVRVLAITKSRFFWLTGLIFLTTLLFLKMYLVLVYVGALWMTLGLYSELEKKGVDWKKSSVLSLFSGLIFGVASFLLITRRSLEHDLVKQAAEPLMMSLKQILPDKTLQAADVIVYMPGLLVSALVSALAIALMFESQIFQIFKLKREKIASGLRWLEFRVPDLFIWLTLFAFLFSFVDLSMPLLQIGAINIAVVSVVVFFFQGITVFEYATRIYRMGRITKILLYFLLVAWALPAVAVLGFADYWLDIRRFMRKRIKVN